MLPRSLKKKARYYFAGKLPGSSFDKKLLKRIERNALMTYLGQITDIKEKFALFRQMDVLVLASRDESCGLVVLEGAMMAKALVVSENVGAKYLVDSSSGYVVKTGDARSLARAFADIIQNPDKLKSMGEAARKKYLETSTMEIYEQNVLSMVNEKLKEADCTVKVQKSYEALAENVINNYDENVKAIIAPLNERLDKYKAFVFIPRKLLKAARFFKQKLLTTS